MEPGHEDREYRGEAGVAEKILRASMEPGHEDREYPGGGDGPAAAIGPQWSPVMKTGNTGTTKRHASSPTSLNGARS